MFLGRSATRSPLCAWAPWPAAPRARTIKNPSSPSRRPTVRSRSRCRGRPRDGVVDARWATRISRPSIRECVANNRDLRIAAARVDEFAAVLGRHAVAGTSAGRLWPQCQSPARERGQDRSSRPASARSARPSARSCRPAGRSTCGAASGAKPKPRAPICWRPTEARRGVVLTLVASVISGYVTLLDLDSRLRVAEETLAGRAEFGCAVPEAARRRLHLRVRDVAGAGGI